KPAYNFRGPFVYLASNITALLSEIVAVSTCSSAPHIGVAEAGRHPQSVGSPLRPSTISVSSRKPGAIGADNHVKKEEQMTTATDGAGVGVGPLNTATDLRANAVPEISGALNILLADMFALYLKTKNFQACIRPPLPRLPSPPRRAG